MEQSSPYRMTWAATLLAIIFVVPGLFVGGLVSKLYTAIMSGYIRESILISRIDALQHLALLWFPSFLHGAIAGGIAIGVTNFAFKSANLKFVTYATAAVWLIVGTVLGALGSYVSGINMGLVALGAQVIGIVAALVLYRLMQVDH